VILDTLANASRYAEMHPGFARAFEFLAATDMTAMAPGRHDLDGDDLFVLINENDGRGEDAARLEVHRRYIDIQYTIQGEELIGWVPLVRCVAPDGAFDAKKDILFFHDRPSTFEEVLADVDQHLAEQRFLATEVVVQRGPADTGGVADLVDRDVGEPACREQLGRDRKQLLAALAHANRGSGPAALTRLGIA